MRVPLVPAITALAPLTLFFSGLLTSFFSDKAAALRAGLLPTANSWKQFECAKKSCHLIASVSDMFFMMCSCLAAISKFPVFLLNFIVV